jgi:hypothetical protein
MVDINTVQEALFNVVQWKNTGNPLERNLSPSIFNGNPTSGIFYNDASGFMKLIDIQASLPWTDLYNYQIWSASTTYNTGDTIYLLNSRNQKIFYISLTDTNLNNDPATDPINWEEKDYFSEYLEDFTKQVCNRLTNDIINQKLMSQKTKGLLADSNLYADTARKRKTVTKMGRFVFYEIRFNQAYNNVTIPLKRLGLFFNQVQTDLPIYLYHSSKADPIATQNVTTTKANDFFWVDLNFTETLSAVNKDTNIGGAYYLGYYEDDVTGEALNSEYNFHSTAPCRSCPGQAANFGHWNKYRGYITVIPGAVDASYLNIDKSIWEVGKENYQYSQSWGLNLKFTVECDLTGIIVDNKNILANALMAGMKLKVAEEHVYTGNTSEQQTRNKTNALYALGNDTQTVYQDYMNEVKSVNFDLSDLDTPCAPREDRIGISMGGM